MDEKIVNELIEELIKLSFAEDIGDGDHTTLCCIPADAIGKQKLLIKEEGILAGVDIARRVFNAFDPELKMEVFMQDGAHVVPGDVPFIVTGKEQSLLQTERLMLNIMQRMSGIATMTARYVKALEGTGTKVLDTRKTTPGMRILEKMAVKIGGGCNHRIGLFEGKNLKIEVEVRNFKELDEALAEGVDRIMFDNFTPEDTAKAVKIVNHRCETESSGGITYDTMLPYAKAGVDYISFGALTHSVKGLDMSFKAVK